MARGDGADYSTFCVIDTIESEVVCEFKGKIPPDQLSELLIEAGRRYGEATLCPESNTYGYAVLMKLRESGYRNIYFRKEKEKFDALFGNGSIGKAGFSTQGGSRAQILTKLEEVVRNDKIKLYSSRLVSEMKTFVWNRGKAQAQRGTNDDLVMALAIGVWLYDADKTVSQTTVDINACRVCFEQHR